MEKHYYIAIDGVIGVGKTTLARLSQQEFSAEILFEVFEENPFLAPFYQDRKRYAFQTELFFLLSRYQQQHEAVPSALARGTLVSDYAFDKNLIFARLNLESDEWEMYARVFAILSDRIPKPDLVVYLRASTDVLIERIALRDRPYERTMDRDYIAALNRAYDDFFARFSLAPVLRIETDTIDIVHRPEDLARVIQSVRQELKAGTYQQPLL